MSGVCLGICGTCGAYGTDFKCEREATLLQAEDKEQAGSQPSGRFRDLRVSFGLLFSESAVSVRLRSSRGRPLRGRPESI
jgi:hypothetical protein